MTGSGVFSEGSLRSVRSGVGLEDVGILADMQSVRAIFSLKSVAGGADDILLVSFPTETRIFRFDAQGGIEEVRELLGIKTTVETLLATNISEGSILQITTDVVQLCNAEASRPSYKPPPDSKITAASANAGNALLAVDGQHLVTINLKCFTTVHEEMQGDQIACVHVSDDLAGIGVVGLWKAGSVKIVKLDDLTVLHTEYLRKDDDASIPRNLALAQLLPRDTHSPTLFVAMEDGVVLTFNVNKNLALTGRKAIVLGTQQARLEIIPRPDGLRNIFATCEHPSLIYGSEGKIIFSAVTAEDAVCTCSFNSAAYPDCLILATSESLKIAQIDTERRTHVKALHLGMTVRRIAYSAKEKAFGIGCIKRELIGGAEHVQSTFQLVDDVVFSELGKPYNLERVNKSEIIECVIRAELPVQHGDGQPTERFLVGTTYLDEAEDAIDNVRGRLLVFGIDSNRNPFLLMSHNLRNACRQLGVMDGKIVAALVKSVVMYRYEEVSEDSASLVKTASYRPSICPIDMNISGNIIAIADLMKSLALVEYQAGSEGLPDSLDEVARHYQAVQATAVVDLEDGVYLESDADGNLIVLQRNVHGVTLEDRKRMEVISEVNLGEMVNRMRKINVESPVGAVVLPRAFMATVSLPVKDFQSEVNANATPDRRRHLSICYHRAHISRFTHATTGESRGTTAIR